MFSNLVGIVEVCLRSIREHYLQTSEITTVSFAKMTFCPEDVEVKNPFRITHKGSQGIIVVMLFCVGVHASKF